MTKQNKKKWRDLGLLRIPLFLFFAAIACFGFEILGVGPTEFSAGLIEKTFGVILICIGCYGGFKII